MKRPVIALFNPRLWWLGSVSISPAPGIQTRLDLIGSIAGLEPSLINENQRIARTGDTAVAPNIANAATTTDTTATEETRHRDTVGYPD